jgi:hypothetical protein
MKINDQIDPTLEMGGDQRRCAIQTVGAIEPRLAPTAL